MVEAVFGRRTGFDRRQIRSGEGGAFMTATTRAGQAPPAAPLISVLLVDAENEDRWRSAHSWIGDDERLELVLAERGAEVSDADFAERLAGVARAVANCRGSFVFPLTSDTLASAKTWDDICAVASTCGDAGVLTLPIGGFPRDRAWRGRRCRGHERNVESLRFASLFPLGSFLVRRNLLRDLCAAGLPADRWWSWRLVATLSRSVRFQTTTTAAVTRGRPLRGEPPQPAFLPPDILAPEAQSKPRVLVFGKVDVSVSLYFDFLRELTSISVGYRQRTRLSADAPHLAAASLVILVRDLDRFWDEGVIDFLDRAGVPYVFFWDDYFITLRAERRASIFFTEARIRRALRGARALWASTPALAEVSAPLHERVEVWSPARDSVLEAALTRPGPVLAVAVAGGDFRLGGLRTRFLDTLEAAAVRAPVRLLVRPSAVPALADKARGVSLIAAPTDESFPQFIRAWRAAGVDILLHPEGDTRGTPFKCPTSAFVAHYLGAVPVVAPEPAYADWSQADGVLVEGAGHTELAAAIEAASDSDWRQAMSGRLAQTIARRFCGKTQARLLLSHLREAPDAATQARRLAEARRPGLAGRKVWRRVVRDWRRLINWAR
jgi:hypothetical protein